MSGSLVANLGLGPETWLFLSLLSCLTLFFKFSRVWSVRNLDLLLLFALAPGMMALVGESRPESWDAYLWLFVGSALWLARCLVDLGLARRPLLEPNLNAAGLACLGVGVLGLLVAETVRLPVSEGARRNPADPGTQTGERDPRPSSPTAELDPSIKTILPPALKRTKPEVILSRILACLAHLGLVASLLIVGWRHFGRPISGLGIAACYLLMPYTRIAVVDSGQLVPAALVTAALAAFSSPAWAGALIGLAAGWMPACLGLLPLWIGFYRGRGSIRFATFALVVLASCALLGLLVPGLPRLARALGARTLAEAGLLPLSGDLLTSGSFWTGFDPSYRLPVLILYAALVVIFAFWPAEKDLGTLIALSAALLVASQFWYLGAGGTLVLLYLPLVLLMMFRPNLAAKRPVLLPPKRSQAQQSLFPIR